MKNTPSTNKAKYAANIRNSFILFPNLIHLGVISLHQKDIAY